MALALCGCHNPVFDYEGDCENKYFLNFVYDMNLKWADAFPSEVHSVNLYVFDSQGLFVKDYLVNGLEIDKAGYNLELDLEPGSYQLVAWCGLNNEGTDSQDFTVPSPVAGVTDIKELTCTLNTEVIAGNEYSSDKMLKFLYHGNMTVELPDTRDGSDYYYTMKLTKDTNHIRVILQQLSAKPMEKGDYSFRITDADGMLAYDNSIVEYPEITYLPWNTDEVIAGVGTENGNSLNSQGVLADLSVSRMMATHAKEFYLTITDNTHNKDIISNIPVIQYALLSKDYYEMAYGHSMTDQEFLDREDEYVLTFFLDENYNWMTAYILINSWRVVLSEYEV